MIKNCHFVQGMWHLDQWQPSETCPSLEQYLDALIDLGVTAFDLADVYGKFACQRLFGQWLGKRLNLRKEIQIISKCNIVPAWQSPGVMHYDSSCAHILASVEQTLQDLQTDYLDLLLLHREDPILEPANIAEAFSMLQRSGKVKHFGVSNFGREKIELLQAYHVPIHTNQIEIHLKHSAPFFNGVVDFCHRHQLQIQAWSPLGQGQFFQPNHPQIQSLCHKYNVEEGALWLMWLWTHPANILPIIGTLSLKRVHQYQKVLGYTLEKSDWFLLLEIYRGHRVP